MVGSNSVSHMIINLVGYCCGKHIVNCVRIGAYEAFVFVDDGLGCGEFKDGFEKGLERQKNPKLINK